MDYVDKIMRADKESFTLIYEGRHIYPSREYR